MIVKYVTAAIAQKTIALVKAVTVPNVLVVNKKRVDAIINPLNDFIMDIRTEDIWNDYQSEMYFFILKRVKNGEATKEILQNSFLKIHHNLEKVKDVTKVKAWVFQIARNEIINFYYENKLYADSSGEEANRISHLDKTHDLCCFDRFVRELPLPYREVVELVYFKGKKQWEVAEQLQMSLANVKVMVRRAKSNLKEKFRTCCKFSLNENGKLVGESNCSRCNFQ